ncbi:GNAT family N-acetyltransferase [uncultured Tateyamaria sp.]|uniref:GNAT family N-acetyltransferase n=1 Tax=uncultured Tateyamaria sp. TaxID=455651 RepID=UPI0026177FC1|nr:GNAT family N-acetyltransferase [uncultured Tateyamaria sp.]
MIRDLSCEDLRPVCDLLRSTQDAHASQYPCIYRSVDEDSDLLGIIETQMSHPGAIALCHVQDGTVSGYLLAVISDVSSGGILVPRRIAMLNEIAVHEQHRRQGIADKLMEEMIRRALEKGASAVRASHAVFNQASARLLERHGFLPVTMTVERDLN